jgi:hypothetical protein
VTLPSDVTVVSGKPVPSHGLPGEVEKTSAISTSESAPSSSCGRREGISQKSGGEATGFGTDLVKDLEDLGQELVAAG